ncbi:hypothetical protein AMQ83_09645, partial [Paenibacillus riograndensis]
CVAGGFRGWVIAAIVVVSVLWVRRKGKPGDRGRADRMQRANREPKQPLPRPQKPDEQPAQVDEEFDDRKPE